MKIRRWFSIFLLMIIATLSCSSKLSAEPIYKVVNEKGEVTYTDSPPPDNKPEELKLPPIITLPATVTPDPVLESATLPLAEQTVPYKSSRIIQPEQNSTVPTGQLEVLVQLALQPRLQPGDQVKLYHNGKLQGEAMATTSFWLTELIRGQHTVRAEVVGSDKRIKTKTQTVTFHVKRYFPKKK